MSYRNDALRSHLKSYLERRATPRHLEGKPAALAEEVDALSRAVGRFAPRDGYEEWWPKFIDKMDEGRRVATWPTVGDIKAAAQAVTGPGSVRPANGDEINPLEIASGRMKRGEPVGDGYLYGKMAVDLIAAGLVDEDTMKRYRSAWFFNAKRVFGEEKALHMEAELKLRHDAAKEAFRQASRPRDVPAIPDKRMEAAE